MGRPEPMVFQGAWPAGSHPVGRKSDLRQVDAVAREFRMSSLDRRLFGLYLEECKGSGHRGTANDCGDFTMDEPRELAREFLGLGGD